MAKLLQLSIRAPKRLSDAIYVELVDLIFDALLPVAVMAVTVVGIGCLIALRKGDIILLALTIAGGLTGITRIFLMLTYRRQKPKNRARTAAEALVWERRFARGSFVLASLIGAINLRALLLTPFPMPMHVPMLVTGLIFGYGAGVVTRIAVRPLICCISLLLAAVPTVIGFATRIADAETGYSIAVFTAQTFLIAGFALASLESIHQIYTTTCQQLQSKMDLAVLAGKDDLTGLPNRVSLRAHFNDSVSVLQETGGLMAFHCLDLDRFKTVNDTLGHPIGDRLLQAVTQRLIRALRAGDTAARLGGDEFVIVQAGIQHPDEAQLLAHRIVNTIAAPYSINGQLIQIGVSIGIALSPHDGLDLEQLIACADAALYQAKRQGRGGVVFWDKCENTNTAATSAA